MKCNPTGLHRIGKACTYEQVTQLGYIGFAKHVLMKVITTGLHMIGKSCTYESSPKWVTYDWQNLHV